MGAHAQHGDAGEGPVLVAVANDLEHALSALAEGADLVDTSACTPRELAVIRERLPADALWTDVPAAAVDADRPLTTPSGGPGEPSPAAAAAVTAISTWLGAPAVRTRHVRAARRAIDMTAAIAGVRAPALTVRGLA